MRRRLIKFEIHILQKGQSPRHFCARLIRRERNRRHMQIGIPEERQDDFVKLRGLLQIRRLFYKRA